MSSTLDDTIKCEPYDKICMWNLMKTLLKLSVIYLIIYKSVLKVKLKISSRYTMGMDIERNNSKEEGSVPITLSTSLHNTRNKSTEKMVVT